MFLLNEKMIVFLLNKKVIVFSLNVDLEMTVSIPGLGSRDVRRR
jgi:hypothetical protein